MTTEPAETHEPAAPAETPRPPRGRVPYGYSVLRGTGFGAAWGVLYGLAATAWYAASGGPDLPVAAGIGVTVSVAVGTMHGAVLALVAAVALRFAGPDPDHTVVFVTRLVGCLLPLVVFVLDPRTALHAAGYYGAVWVESRRHARRLVERQARPPASRVPPARRVPQGPPQPRGPRSAGDPAWDDRDSGTLGA